MIGKGCKVLNFVGGRRVSFVNRRFTKGMPFLSQMV